MRPSVLFVCVKNAGKSQMTAALMRKLAGDFVTVHSAGTRPGGTVNALSAAALAELGIDITGEEPKLLDDSVISEVDVVATLGREAHVEWIAGTRFETWDTIEPSDTGIDGIERMRLIRDDIARRVRVLAADLGVRSQPHRSWWQGFMH